MRTSAHVRALAAALMLAVVLAFGESVHAADAAIEAPNVVPISPRLITSGQPTAAALSLLAAQGFQESVARVWSPDGPWKRLLVSQLRKAGIEFEPY